MLYIFDEVGKLSDDFHIRLAPYLSQERIEKIGRIKSSSQKGLSAAVYALLRYALAVKYGIDEPVLFDYGKNEKPRLKDFPYIHFNLSHTASAVACALSDSPIGVDVQRISNVSDKVAERVLTKQEFKEFLQTENQDEYFCRLWTIKESLLKQTGQGIAAEFREMSADGFSDITVYKGDDYYCCITKANAAIEKVSFDNLINREENHV
ncbi:MAG: 4'-phosphopantetheinyl transferase superfamily protein [Oscillospiraceae bacterium]|nr:4'-phosphopantetheinyl transferase superfamily protein [Oscillospiraceae bacterium]MCL2277853.1 4'-phosphopantetheinyl transferase superfamily protein [Oscillospiraceae bacterium]